MSHDKVRRVHAVAHTSNCTRLVGYYCRRTTSAFHLTDAERIQQLVSMLASLRNDLNAEAGDAEVMWLQVARNVQLGPHTTC
jgi:hypothetical protein